MFKLLVILYIMNFLPEKNLSEKAATIKRLEYSFLGKGSKEQTGIAENNIKD